MKHKILILIFIVAFGIIYFNTHFVKIDGVIHRTNIKVISPNLNYTSISEINKCSMLETLYLTSAKEGLISELKEFNNLKDLVIMRSYVSSLDYRKISSFKNLKELTTYYTVSDFKEFHTDSIYSVIFMLSYIKNFDMLSKCKSLKSITLSNTLLSDDCVTIENKKYIMSDSSIFKSFDYIEELRLFLDEIKDISGILEMDSLETFYVHKDSISEEDVKLLEDKGITVIFTDN